MSDKQAVFLERPEVGQRVRIAVGGQESLTSPVVRVESDRSGPGKLRVLTQSGSVYVGGVLEDTTIVVGSGGASPPGTPEPTIQAPPGFYAGGGGIPAKPSSPQFTDGLWHPGQAPNAELLPLYDAQRLNWGACLLPLFWSIAHRVWIGVLSVIPAVNLAISLILLVKGNELAWQNRHFRSIEEFRTVQRAWLDAGIALIVFLIVAIFIVLAFVRQQA